MRYFLEIAYQGSHYHGWQIQPNSISVQEVVNRSLSTIINDEISTSGCGRTDAGVHASQFFLHFDTEKTIPENLVYKLNRILPKDISVYRWFAVEPEAHVRYDANYRAYDYFLHRTKNPFLDSFSTLYPAFDLDVDKMRKAFKSLSDYSDFSPFEKVNNDARTSTCEIYKLELLVNEDESRFHFHIAANRFLRGMVRRIVGCTLDIGRGKTELDELEEVMKSAGNFKLNTSAPPQGLFLSEVRYPAWENAPRPLDLVKW